MLNMTIALPTAPNLKGPRGSPTVPCLDLWRNMARPSGSKPIGRERRPVRAGDPLSLQIDTLRGVVSGEGMRVISSREGPKTLTAIAAAKEAAATGQAVTSV